MSLKAKKISTVQLILSIENEFLLDAINARIVQLLPNNPLAKYIGQIEDKLDLAKVKKEQNYTGTNPKKLEALADAVQIEEPIEELLAMK